VCVVGAGIAGLSTAYLLSRAGKNVVVLDAGEVAEGQTGRTTAHLASALDDRFTELVRLFGADGARLAAESHAAALDRVEAVCREEAIDCDFQRLDGYLFNPPSGKGIALEEERNAALEAGLGGVEMVARAPLPAFDTGPCLRFPRQGQFHPTRYLAGLAGAIRPRRGRVCTP